MIYDQETMHDPHALALLGEGEDWRSMAACQSVDPDLFFPLSDTGPGLEQAARAKAVCAGCRVRRQCLSFALLTQQRHGVWGGTSEQERHITTRMPAGA
jgi:WhiB family redox-sensing transcriptional regulator